MKNFQLAEEILDAKEAGKYDRFNHRTLYCSNGYIATKSLVEPLAGHFIHKCLAANTFGKNKSQLK